MRSTFEEKTYESYFNTELNSISRIYFPIGQVQEGCLGFDSSSYSRSRKLWKYFGHPFLWGIPFVGCDLYEIAEEMEKYLGVHINNLPQIKVNLLFQYKKPEYIASSLGKEWEFWKTAYYRYDIYEEQQELLMNINATLGSKVCLLYAAPAIHDVNDLVKAHKAKNIIKLSNFKKIEDLDCHHRNTYVKSGTYSIACSEPEKSENFDLIRYMSEDFTDGNNNRDFTDNSDLLIGFKNKITSIVYENKFYGESFRLLNKEIDRFEEFDILHSMLVMNNFKQLLGTQWILKL